MKAEMTKDLQKKVTKYGSVLKAYRAGGGGGMGLFAAGVFFLIVGVLLGVPLMFVKVSGGLTVLVIFGVPALIFILAGQLIHKKRVAGYLEYFQKETGYSQEELMEADRELLGPEAVKIVCETDMSNGKEQTVFFVTQHYFLSVWPVYGCYLRKLDDIVAAFYSNEIPGIDGYRQNLFVITRQDTQQQGRVNEYTQKQYLGFENALLKKNRNCRQICDEVVGEMVVRAPHIITRQYIVVNDIHEGKEIKYNLLSMDNWQRDWAKILGV